MATIFIMSNIRRVKMGFIGWWSMPARHVLWREFAFSLFADNCEVASEKNLSP